MTVAQFKKLYGSVPTTWEVYGSQNHRGWVFRVALKAPSAKAAMKSFKMQHAGLSKGYRYFQARPTPLNWMAQANPQKALSMKLPMSKWKRAKVRRLPGGKFQVKVD